VLGVNCPGRKVGAFSFYAQVLKSVNADFGIDILFTIAVHKKHLHHDLRKSPLQLGNIKAKNYHGRN
jgi:hypothetical protein